MQVFINEVDLVQPTVGSMTGVGPSRHTEARTELGNKIPRRLPTKEEVRKAMMAISTEQKYCPVFIEADTGMESGLTRSIVEAVKSQFSSPYLGPVMKLKPCLDQDAEYNAHFTLSEDGAQIHRMKGHVGNSMTIVAVNNHSLDPGTQFKFIKCPGICMHKYIYL